MDMEICYRIIVIIEIIMATIDITQDALSNWHISLSVNCPASILPNIKSNNLLVFIISIFILN